MAPLSLHAPHGCDVQANVVAGVTVTPLVQISVVGVVAVGAADERKVMHNLHVLRSALRLPSPAHPPPTPHPPPPLPPGRRAAWRRTPWCWMA